MRSVVEVWYWLRINEFTYWQNVSVSTSKFALGGDTVCANGLTGTASSTTTGAIKVPCAAAKSTDVQYVNFESRTASATYMAVLEVLVLRDGEALWQSTRHVMPCHVICVALPDVMSFGPTSLPYVPDATHC